MRDETIQYVSCFIFSSKEIEGQGRLYHIGEIGNRLGRQNLGGIKVEVKFSFL